ncbi:sigma 54-interacting transcriptional regulator [Alkaliphilus peptidifermentans]|uniref:Transcriptional regulator containing PAS, AAA-type ATPase, and DNA-binding Fis domains n=1 Tax=Alkaliphilus peptidifermentans DSM 18978 TaxID=1120976 RepID=A0A1G5D939_9FIRM|nr:sigma 54-interacting transcriptional regulator [Alkaliphilus peptidifermentans]SCY11195.1 Transcriptional regulator containing PAS, AAA-type ATPase, and DNA-binding Fis domains [Alkaliphilus peptidifermentans DSM 18978]
MLENQLLDYTIHEILSTNFIKVLPVTPLDSVIDEMLYSNIPEAIIIDPIDNDKILGLITLTDISRIKQEGHSTSLPVSKYMSENILSVPSDMLITDVRKTLIDSKIGRVPVYENKKLIGIIRIDNLLNSYYLKLESINRQYKDVINHMHEAVTVTDPAGNVLLWNKKAELIYDIKEKDIIYKKLEDFFPNALTLSVLEEQIPIENIYHAPKPNYYVIISALPVFIDGEFVGVVATEKDITENRDLSLKLENANLEIDLLKEEVEKFTKDSFTLGKILGKSPAIKNKIQLAKHVSKSNTSVIIVGESGTGKEVFARAIHQHSQRKGHFVPVNCSAIPPTLFESEFFGYVGGAFTGALKNGKIGYFELANNGTLFLDEIGDLPLNLQAKLLRVLQEGKVLRVGADKLVDVDVRIISATNRNLKEMVRTGKFREDLFYRLDVVQIELPPLRNRREDISLLFNHFIEEISRKNNTPINFIDKDLFNILLKYHWKGNIRELKNTVEYMVVLSNDKKITKDLIPQYIIESINETKNSKVSLENLEDNLKNLEIEMINKAMVETRGNKAKAAKLLNIPRSTLYYKLNLYKGELSV